MRDSEEERLRREIPKSVCYMQRSILAPLVYTVCTQMCPDHSKLSPLPQESPHVDTMAPTTQSHSVLFHIHPGGGRLH